MSEKSDTPARHDWLPHLPQTPGDWKIAVVFGAFGGLMPPLLKLASSCLGNEEVGMPRVSFWAAVLFLGLVGAVVSAAFSQHTKREAFIAGILAPSLVANLIGGYQEGAIKRPVIKASEIFVIGSPAHADEASRTRKLDFEWALDRPDAAVAQVKVEFRRTVNDPKPATYYVSPTFSGVIEPKDEYKYIVIDQTTPILIPPGDSQLLIRANTRTSLTNDFLWALGSPRVLKVRDTKVEFLPMSYDGQKSMGYHPK